MSYTYTFPRPSVTATVVFFSPDGKDLLVGVRTSDNEVYPGMPCLMGGFMDPRINHKDLTDNYGTPGDNPVIRPGETVEQTAIREAMEEFNVPITANELKLFMVGSSDAFDPRAHVVNLCYYVILDDRRMAQATAGDDIEDLLVFAVKDFMERTPRMAFNHADIALQAIAACAKDSQLVELEKKYANLVGECNDLKARVSDMGWELNPDRQGGA